MKRSNISHLTLSVVTGLALVVSSHAFAQDANPNDKKPEKQVAHQAKAPVKNAPVVARTQTAPTVHRTSFQKQAPGTQAATHVAVQQPVTAAKHSVRNQSTTAVNSNAAPVNTQSSQQQRSRTTRATSQVQTAQAQSAQRQSGATQGNAQFTRANNYGGRWTAGNSHPDWNQGQQYSWNSHQYRWYDGGWLIVDGGFWPGRGYQGGGSMVANVQAALANQGYYNGGVDGVYGPGTSRAIADFQRDSGLRVTGTINSPLIQALGIQ